MRTTLNVDDDLAAQLAHLARAEHRSLSRVANDLMRAGLRAVAQPARPEPYVPPTFDSGRPGLDVTDVAQALEILDEHG
jgi:hypothetical protein